jgi:Spy/CpxP family protein refolding chaperone
MILKKLSSVAVLAALALSAAGLFAQGFDPKQMVERQMTQLKEQLELTDEQVPKVKEVLEGNMKSMMELREKYPFTPGEQPSDEAREAMAKSRREANEKMAKVLTEAQMEKYQKIQRERGMGAGKGGGKGSGKGGNQ